MKKGAKALVLAGTLIVIGAVFVTIGSAAAFKNRSFNNSTQKELSEMTYEATSSEINFIDVSLVSEDVKVEQGNSDKIVIKYYDSEKEPDIKITEKNNTLEMTRNNGSFSVDFFSVVDIVNWFSIGNNNEENLGQTVVIVPRSFEGKYSIETVSGNLVFAAVPAEETIDLDTTSGDIKIADIDCKSSINADTISGEISIDNVNMEGDLTIGTTSGDIHLNSVKADKEISIDTISGSTYGSDVTTEFVTLNATSGDARITQLTVEKGISGDSVSGEYEIQLTDNMENYNIEVDTVSGEFNIPSKYKGTGEKTMSFSTTSGDVEVNFTK